MTHILGNVDWVAELVPDLETNKEQFIVNTAEVDDELIEVFTGELRRLTEELQEGLASGNSETVRMAAHSIKGMGGTIGLPEISVLGLEIENRAKQERLEDARPLIEALVGWLATL